MKADENEKRKTKNEKRGKESLCRFSFFVLLFSFALVAGCSTEKHGPTTRPSTMRDRQEAALRDPMGYSPDMNSPDSDISGGKLNEFDRKAMRKDLDHVLNP
jgi:hypothetical protein